MEDEVRIEEGPDIEEAMLSMVNCPRVTCNAELAFDEICSCVNTCMSALACQLA